MRRHDYELIAQALKAARPLRPSLLVHGSSYEGWRNAVESVGTALTLDNNAFDYQLWLHNCGVTPT